MALEFIPYSKDVINGQAILDNFQRTRRMLRYKGDNDLEYSLSRGMPLFEVTKEEHVGEHPDNGNMLIRGECVSACAYLKKNNIKVDLVYIDPPFASGADYAKKILLRRDPLKAAELGKASQELDDEEYRSFEEKMYGDIWNKELYLNWMYENLCAIKDVMSDSASIYVHLDWHICHYVKIMMDEIFGEDNFINEIIWCYAGPSSSKKSFGRKHDTIFLYSKTSDYSFNQQFIKHKSGLHNTGQLFTSNKSADVEALQKQGKKLEDWWIDIYAGDRYRSELLGYATQKPEALLERIIKASSDEGMVVADFFGGSGVTAAVANKLGRKFIHADIGINSIQTARDRLVADKTSFSIYEIQDGVSLYRNPVQTMDKLKSLIPGLVNEDSLDKFWEGAMSDPELGLIPVYVPNLLDSRTRYLDIPLFNRIIQEAMPDLPDDVKKVIIYYIDADDLEKLKQFYKEQGNPLIKIEFRDLKPVLLFNTISDDICKFKVHLEDTGRYTVKIDYYHSPRIQRKLDEYNARYTAAVMDNKKPKGSLMEISKEGLECVEMVSLDCTSTDGDIWHSDYELKIGADSKVIINGERTSNYWDATLNCDRKPLRIKIRNICGDEAVFHA